MHAIETAALSRALATTAATVTSAAAAVVEDQAARNALEKATVVWFRAQPSTLRMRIGSGSGRREEATDPDWLANRAHARETLYASVADLIIDVDERSPSDIAGAIEAWLAQER